MILEDITVASAFHTYLVSAYDIYYGYMPYDPNELPNTEYLFIDSGGYETSDGFDFAERNKFNYQVLSWNKSKMKEVYSRVINCPKWNDASIIISSYDNDGAVDTQMSEAFSLVEAFPKATVDFIIKGNNPTERALHRLSTCKDFFEPFAIIGFTEKELGNTIQERLLSLIRLRRRLTECDWNGYIHIFGGLEPNLAALYFIAGADAFDGLSWQRMYYENRASQYSPRSYNVSLREYENKFLMMIDNLWILQRVSNDLSIYLDTRLERMISLESILQGSDLTINDLLVAMEVQL